MTENEREEEGLVFEIAVVVPKLGENRGDEREEAHCVDVLVDELKKKGLTVERVVGLQNEFIKVNLCFIFSGIIIYILALSLLLIMSG